MEEVRSVRVDKDADILFCSVGLYKLFLAGGQAGIEAKQLYDHLMFTARIQETREVYANNTYLSRGLGWGMNRVKRAKAWLSERGIIEYVRRRRGDGSLGKSFIRISRMWATGNLPPEWAETGVEPDPAQGALDFGHEDVSDDGGSPAALAEEDEPAGASAESAHTGGLADPEEEESGDSATGTESDPVVKVKKLQDRQATTGMADHPLVSQTSGCEQQILKTRNKMLGERNSNALSRPPGGGKRAPPPSGEQSGVKEASREFTTAYERRFGVRPPFEGKEYKLLKGDVERVGVERFKTAVSDFFADRVPAVSEFVSGNAGYKYNVFHSQLDKLIQFGSGESSGESGGTKRAKFCPQCGAYLLDDGYSRARCPNCNRDFDWDERRGEWVEWVSEKTVRAEEG